MKIIYTESMLKIINTKSLAKLKTCTHCLSESKFYSFEYNDNSERLSCFVYCELCLDMYLKVFLKSKVNYYTSIKYFPYHNDYNLFMKQLNECELILKKILLLR